VNRATEGSQELARRLRNARDEMDAAGSFDYLVVNDDLERAVGQIRELVRAETHRTSRARQLGLDVDRIRSAIDRILEEGVASPRG
jgi:guanylate kinase